MSLSKKQIFNNALAKVCRKRISSVDEDSELSNLCAVLYDQALEEAIGEHNWGCLTQRVQLVKLANDPTFAYANAFQLPNDLVELIQAYRTTCKQSFDFEWEISQNRLLTDSDTVYIRYTFMPEHIENIDIYFREVLIMKLAILLSYPIQAGDGNREAQLLQQYETKTLPRAKARDSMNSRYQEFEESPWIESLYGNTPSIN